MEYENEILDLFSEHVSDRFTDLLPPSRKEKEKEKEKEKDVSTPAAESSVDSPYFVHPNFLSISWFRCLLDAFLCCEAEFKAAVIMGRDPSHFAKPPLDRLIPELLDRSVKALDVSNAVTSGIELARQWQQLGQIAVSALEQRPLGEGQVRRAKKALNTLLGSMSSDDKDAAERSWSFGGPASKDRGGNFRSFSWSVAKTWSASKQIQAMSSNLVAPRGGEQTGLALPVYIMSNVLVFAMWALVAGIPCQERAGLSTHLNVPRQLDWAKPMMTLHEKISEEWKKKEKKGAAGLLDEIQKMERFAKSLLEFTDSFEFPVDEEKAKVMAEQLAGLAEVCRVMEEGLLPLQQQVREVFHRLVRSRAQIHDVVDQIGKCYQTPSTPH